THVPYTTLFRSRNSWRSTASRSTNWTRTSSPGASARWWTSTRRNAASSSTSRRCARNSASDRLTTEDRHGRGKDARPEGPAHSGQRMGRGGVLPRPRGGDLPPGAVPLRAELLHLLDRRALALLPGVDRLRRDGGGVRAGHARQRRP